jgi:hypothetical protein
MTYAYNILKSKDPKSKYAYPSREYVVGANIQAGMLKIIGEPVTRIQAVR